MAVEIKGVGWHNVGAHSLNLGHIVYPWHKWLNGSMWILVPGRDFEQDIKAFQQYAHEYSSKWGIKIRTKQNEARNCLFFQAYKASSKQGDRRRRHFRRYERTWKVLYEGMSKWDYEASDFLRDGKYDGTQWVDFSEVTGDEPASDEEAKGAVWARDDEDD